MKCVEYHNKIEELEDAIKVKDMLIEQLENQNDRLIAQRDAQEQQLAIYKRALELENEERFKNINSIWMVEDDNRTKFINSAKELTNYFLDKAKKELEEQDVKNS